MLLLCDNYKACFYVCNLLRNSWHMVNMFLIGSHWLFATMLSMVNTVPSIFDGEFA